MLEFLVVHCLYSYQFSRPIISRFLCHLFDTDDPAFAQTALQFEAHSHSRIGACVLPFWTRSIEYVWVNLGGWFECFPFLAPSTVVT